MKQSRISVALAALVAFTMVLLALGLGTDNGATKSPDHITLTWTGNSATTMTVTWRTDPTVESGFVQYQEGTTISAEANRQRPLAITSRKRHFRCAWRHELQFPSFIM